MIHTQIALLQRELWEHKSVLVVPVVVALVTLLTSWTSQVTIGELEYLDIGIISAGNMPENVRAAALSFTMIGLAVSFIIAMWILTIFYTLDALYAERKDRSILFWRSIPVTDSETVVSKLLTALVTIPLTLFFVVGITNAFNLLDNMDGLASGVAAICALTIFLFNQLLGTPQAIGILCLGGIGVFLVCAWREHEPGGTRVRSRHP